MGPTIVVLQTYRNIFWFKNLCNPLDQHKRKIQKLFWHFGTNYPGHYVADNNIIHQALSTGIGPEVCKFHWIGPLGRFSHIVAMSVCLSVCLSLCLSPPHAIFFQASHWPRGHMTRSQASCWSPSPHPLRGPSYVSCVTCHVSHVSFHVSHVTNFLFYFFIF